MDHATLDIIMYRPTQANLHAMALIGTYKAIVILQKLGVHKKIQLWAQNYNAYHSTSQLITNYDLILPGEHNTTNKPIMSG